MQIYPGISMDSDVCCGRPCLTGTCVDVAFVLGALAAGDSVHDVLEECRVTPEQIRDALAYAAHLAAHVPPAVGAVC